ncbi:MAG: methyltransferase domain-containing protein [Candidatus Heimdallarchaeota archaeon]|nr:methyltransferase domain-containing protein [Candidatus Heimdallarchaeota archaeon]
MQHPYQIGDLRPDFPINLWIPSIGNYKVSELKGRNQFERYDSWKSQKVDIPINDNDIVNHYDAIAEEVSEGYIKSAMLLEIIYPAIISEVGDLKGKTILDFGCGPGGLTRQLAIAKQVVGLDPSNMIDIAIEKEQEKSLGIIYHKSDLPKIKNQYLHKFDVIVSNAVLTEISDLPKVLRDLSDVMKQDGTIIFTVRHPSLRPPGAFSSMTIPTDSERNEDLIMTRKNYFAEGPYKLSVKDHVLDGAITHHYTISTYINTLTQLGYIIVKLFEPKPSYDLIKTNPKVFKGTQEYHPMFLGIVARKS